MNMDRVVNREFGTTYDFNSRDWSDLPDSILFIILDKLMKIQDYIRFGAVCKSWRSIYNESRVNHLPRDPILLMLPPQFNHGGKDERSLYSLSDKKVYHFQVSIPHDRFCCGSNYGWLITFSKHFEVRLINPFLSINNKIELPPMPWLEPEPIIECGDIGNYLHKAVLLGNPTSDPNYVIIVSHGHLRRLSIFKAAIGSWTHLDPKYRFIHDVIFYQDKAYALNRFGCAWTVDINHPNLEVSVIVGRPEICQSVGPKYLVESDGDLFLVVRLLEVEPDDYKTVLFTVSKLNPVCKKWDEVRNIGGCMFFVGDNCSLSLSVSDMPGCKPNCIYFTDDYKTAHFKGGGPHDMGVFNLEDGKIEPHFPVEPNMFPAPFFIRTPL